MLETKTGEPTMEMQAVFRLFLTYATNKHRLPLGRCACHEPSVRWCTRHGLPLKAARSRFDQLALT
jgi:hypothetical protein